jgi:hypothetical protein
MSLSRGDMVRNLDTVFAQPGFFVKEIPPHTPGVVLDLEGGTFTSEKALVRFMVDGKEVEAWVETAALLRV